MIWLKRPSMHRGLLLVVVVILLIAVIASQGGQVVAWMARQEQQLRHWQQVFPVRTFCVGCFAYFLSCFIPGTNGKAFMAGWLFGIVGGASLVNLASTLAALVMFFASRHQLRDHIQSRYAGFLLAIRKRLRDDGGVYLLAIRLVPIMPYSAVNLIMGVTEMRPRTFWWATQLGMLPGNLAFAWAGTSLPSLQEAQEKTWTELIDLQVLVAFGVLLCLPLLTSAMGRLIAARRRLGRP